MPALLKMRDGDTRGVVVIDCRADVLTYRTHRGETFHILTMMVASVDVRPVTR